VERSRQEARLRRHRLEEHARRLGEGLGALAGGLAAEEGAEERRLALQAHDRRRHIQRYVEAKETCKAEALERMVVEQLMQSQSGAEQMMRAAVDTAVACVRGSLSTPQTPDGGLDTALSRLEDALVRMAECVGDIHHYRSSR
jgi:hypothetical protein